MTSPKTDRPAARSRRRRWFPLIVAAAVAGGLGIAAYAGQADDAPAAQQATAVSGAAAPSAGPASSDTSQPGLITSAAPASRTPPSSDDVAAEVVQPEPYVAPSAGEKAPPIGPFGDLSLRTEGDPLAVGDADAPVVMVMFSDYRCPFCALFSQTLEQPLVDKYVTSGVLRIEWRDFPVFGDESARAAAAGRAAAAQGRFWEFNKAVYAAAPERGHPSLSDATLVAFARQAGVKDLDRFTADLDNPKYIAAVAADFDDGNQLGVPATPSFIINGYPLRGAQPISEFEQLIDTVAALAETK